MGEACIAIYFLNSSSFKRQKHLHLWLSAEGTVIYTSSVPHCEGVDTISLGIGGIISFSVLLLNSAVSRPSSGQKESTTVSNYTVSATCHARIENSSFFEIHRGSIYCVCYLALLKQYITMCDDRRHSSEAAMLWDRQLFSVMDDRVMK